MLRIDPTTLADGHALDTIGNLDPNPTAIVGTPDSGSTPRTSSSSSAASIDFGADPNNRKMQVVTRDALDALVALLTARGTPGRLQVTQAFVPPAPGLKSVGRRLILGHETLDAGVLGALASRFFDIRHARRRVGHGVRALRHVDRDRRRYDRRAVPAEIVLGTALDLAVVPGTLGTLTTTGPTAAANATLNFAAVPADVQPGWRSLT